MNIKKINAIFKEENKVSKQVTEVKKDIFLNTDSILGLLEIPEIKRTVVLVTGMQILVDSSIDDTMVKLGISVK